MQLFVDNLWITGMGLALVWAFGNYEESISYALGAVCGFGYLVLLGAYVESIGKTSPGRVKGSRRREEEEEEEVVPGTSLLVKGRGDGGLGCREGCFVRAFCSGDFPGAVCGQVPGHHPDHPGPSGLLHVSGTDQ